MFRTYQPKKRQRSKEHGFRKRMATRNGRKVLARRRASRPYWCFSGKCNAPDKQTGKKRERMDPQVTVKENGDFRRIYRKGRSAVSGGVVVYCLKNRKGMSRLGVTVSTKLGHAVVRNRVRRRLRELYRLHRQEMLPGYDLIVVARVRAVDMPYAKLEKQYLRCLAQLGLLREDV